MSAALPSHPDMEQEEIILQGKVPSPLNPPSGCYFHPRCPVAMDRCSVDKPESKEISPGHTLTCHLPPVLKFQAPDWEQRNREASLPVFIFVFIFRSANAKILIIQSDYVRHAQDSR
jgi:oligopeptide/dipeptide ABC transporter ATP-binding protein